MGGGRPLKHLLSKVVGFTAASLIFFQLGWGGLSGRLGAPAPDARHTAAIRWRGGSVTYMTPEEKLIWDWSFWCGFFGIWLAIGIELGLDAIDRRREARGLPKLRF